MSDRSKIEWTDATYNPVTGCSTVSTGCLNCYARRMANRLAGRFGYPADKPFQVTLHEDRLEQPLRWRKPRRIFVCSMSDLFHPDVPDKFIVQVFHIMYRCPQHTFLVLTKRSEHMAEFTTKHRGDVIGELPNVWLGVSGENRESAARRIPHLIQCPAAVRFLSIEPMLGPVRLRLKSLKPTRDYEFGDAARARIHQIIVGCESGPGARPMELDWVRSIRDQCMQAGVAFFLKQMMVNGKLVKLPELDGRQWTEIPDRCC